MPQRFFHDPYQGDVTERILPRSMRKQGMYLDDQKLSTRKEQQSKSNQSVYVKGVPVMRANARMRYLKKDYEHPSQGRLVRKGIDVQAEGRKLIEKQQQGMRQTAGDVEFERKYRKRIGPNGSFIRFGDIREILPGKASRKITRKRVSGK